MLHLPRSIAQLAAVLAVCSSGALVSAQAFPENWDDRFFRTGMNAQVRTMHAKGDTLYVGGIFTKAGGITVNLIGRFDGRTWSAMGSGLSAQFNSVNDIDAFGSYVYACDKFGLHRWDGTAWTQVGVIGGLPGSDLGTLAIAVDANGQVYMTGSFTSVNGVSANRVARFDGSNWHAMGTGIVQPQPGLGNNVAYTMAAIGTEVYMAGIITTMGGTTFNNVARWNGTAWSPMAGGLPTYGVPQTLAVVNGQLHLGTGAIGPINGPYTANVLRWTGTSWSVVGNSFDLGVTAIASHDGELYAGGLFTSAGGQPVNYIARLSGNTWLDAGNTVGMSYVPAMAICSHGVYAGGITNLTDEVDMNNLIRYDGTQWGNIGEGVGDPEYGGQVVNAVIRRDGQTYIGGRFDQVGGVRSMHVAQWDGDQWIDIGFPFGEAGRVNALAIKGDTLFAGGLFPFPDELQSTNLAMRVNGEWLPMGSGANDEVFALTVHDNDLYIGGEFSQINGVGCGGVGRWNGSQFSPVGFGANGVVRALTFGPDGTLYAGGNFTLIGGVSCSRMAQWNGTAWSPVAYGVNNWVNAIAVLPDGSPVFGGQFTFAPNGGFMTGVARFNGTTLEPMGYGLNGSVEALLAKDGHLLACGSFAESGPTIVNGIARWNGTDAWEPIGEGLGVDPQEIRTGTSMDLECDKLAVGGSFSYAGGKRADRISAYTFNLPRLDASDAIICEGTELVLSVLGVDPQAVSDVQWLVNGSPVLGDGLTLTTSEVTDGSTVEALVTLSVPCTGPVVRTSNSVEVQVIDPSVPVVQDNGTELSVVAPIPSYTYIWQTQVDGLWTDVVPAATGAMYTYPQGGLYRVRVLAGNCERSSEPVAVFVTGMQDPRSPAFRAYPNPVKDMIQISGTAPIDRVQVLDPAGRIVFMDKFHAGAYEVTLQLSHLSNGVYLLCIEARGATSFLRAVVGH